jgi:hypothetical protein
LAKIYNLWILISWYDHSVFSLLLYSCEEKEDRKYFLSSVMVIKVFFSETVSSEKEGAPNHRYREYTVYTAWKEYHSLKEYPLMKE